MMFGRWLLIWLVVATAAATSCGGAGKSPTARYSAITSRELRAEIDAGQKLTIVDLREPELYRAGRIPGAQNIPFDQFEQRMNELRPDARIVLVCHNGPMGDVSGSLLAERGYAKVSNLNGGMAAWDGRIEK